MPQSQDILNDISTKIIMDKKEIQEMSLSKLIDYIQLAQQELGKKYNVIGEIRQVDSEVFEELREKIKMPGAKLVFRHGEQDFNEEDLNAEQKKIIMMQSPHNEKDPITSLSAIEVFSTAAILVNMNLNVAIQSSSNLRAKQPAEILGEILGTQVEFLNELDCINYPSEPEFSTKKLNTFLNDGALPWEKNAVDEIAGAGTYERIVKFAESFIVAPIKADTLVTITHTQQTNAICKASNLESPRFSSFGFAFISPLPKIVQHKIYANGFYSSQKFDLQDINVSKKGKEITLAFNDKKQSGTPLPQATDGGPIVEAPKSKMQRSG